MCLGFAEGAHPRTLADYLGTKEGLRGRRKEASCDCGRERAMSEDERKNKFREKQRQEQGAERKRRTKVGQFNAPAKPPPPTEFIQKLSKEGLDKFIEQALQHKQHDQIAILDLSRLKFSELSPRVKFYMRMLRDVKVLNLYSNKLRKLPAEIGVPPSPPPHTHTYLHSPAADRAARRRDEGTGEPRHQREPHPGCPARDRQAHELGDARYVLPPSLLLRRPLPSLRLWSTAAVQRLFAAAKELTVLLVRNFVWVALGDLR